MIKNLLFRLGQALYFVKKWKTGVYPCDTQEKEEIIRHLEIAKQLLLAAQPKYEKARALEKERKKNEANKKAQ